MHDRRHSVAVPPDFFQTRSSKCGGKLFELGHRPRAPKPRLLQPPEHDNHGNAQKDR